LRCLFVLLLLVKVQLIGTIVLEAQSEFEDVTSITPLDILVPTVLPTSYDVFSTTTEAEPETKPEAEPETKPEAEPETKLEAEPEPDPEPEAEPEPDPEPEADLSITDHEIIASSSTVSPEIPAIVPKSPVKLSIVNPNLPRVAIPFVIASWVFISCFAKLGISFLPSHAFIVPESCWLIVSGIVLGTALYIFDVTLLSPLSAAIFFFCMLPPVILDAGYCMPNRLFFDHLGTILLFAIAGTIFNTFTIGVSLWLFGLTGIYGFDIPLLETLIFSALISAVDPVAVLTVFEEINVDRVLYIIVFGESLLNDAVSIVLYNMFNSFLSLGPENIEYSDVLIGCTSFAVVAIGGTSIGIFWGFVTAIVTKFTYRTPTIEPVFIFVMSYLAYVNAEALQMSGILSITFCGITMKNYVEANISESSQTTVRHTMKMLSHGSEAVIFLFLGVNTVHDKHQWNTPFIFLTVIFCTIYRGVGVILLTEVANRFRLHKLDWVEKFIMSYGGLRGAIAFALVLSIDPKTISFQPLFITTTLSVVYFTVFFQGITVKPLVNFLKVKREETRVKTMNERTHEKMMDYTMAGIEDMLGMNGNYILRNRFKLIDQRYIRPLLLRVHNAHEPKILETYSKLIMEDAVKFAHSNPITWPSKRAGDSFVGLLRNDASVQSLDSVRVDEEQRGGIELTVKDSSRSSSTLTAEF